MKRIKRKYLRLKLHGRALVNYSQGYAWSCIKRDRKTKHTI